MIIGHGGNIHDVAARLGCDPADIIDMSSNINPLGALPGLIEHLKERLGRITVLRHFHQLVVSIRASV